MTEEYLSDKYRCEESGLTNIDFSRFGLLLSFLSMNPKGDERTKDIISSFNKKGMGDNSDEIRQYIERHIPHCQDCKILYGQITPARRAVASLLVEAARRK